MTELNESKQSERISQHLLS